MACINCKHLVTYISKGLSYSEQIKYAGPWTMFLVDTFDTFINQAKNTFSKSFSCLVAVKLISSFVKVATNELLNVASKFALNATLQTVKTVCNRILNLCKYTCSGSQYAASQILGSTNR